jgi:hypothetical protein
MAEPVILQAQGVGELTLKAGATAKVGDLLGHDGTGWVLADADGRVPAQCLAMEYGAAAARIHVCQAGVLYDSDAPYTAGNDQYLSATAGAHTATVPAISTTLTLLQRLGKALSVDSMVFDLAQRGPLSLRARAAVDPASLAANAVANTAVTVTGVLAGDLVQALPPADLEGDIALQSALATADNTVTLRLHNVDDANAVDGAAKNWDFYVSRF